MLQPRKMRTEARTTHVVNCLQCGEPERAWSYKTRKHEVRKSSTDVKEILCSTCVQRNLYRNNEQE